MRLSAGDGSKGWLIALGPGVLVLVVEILVWPVDSISGTDTAGWIGLYALGAAVVAGLLAPVAIAVTRQRDALTWIVVSVCVSGLCLFLGALIWFGAAVAACGHGCLS